MAREGPRRREIGKMRLPRFQFSLARLMIAVAVAGVACWAVFATPFVLQPVIVFGLGPLAGACRARLVVLKPFDPSTRPELRDELHPIQPAQDRMLQTILGGIQGGVAGAFVVSVVGAVVFVVRTGVGFRRYGLHEILSQGLVLLVVILGALMISLMAGFVVGNLVGLTAEGVSTWTTRQRKGA
jgi:hypothetical protein